MRDYLFDLGKILEGAANGDYSKVLAYGKQLGEKLDASGEKGAAKRVREILGKSKASQLALARSPDRENVLPVDSESRIPTADEEHPAKGEVAIFLSAEAKETIDQFIAFFRAADQLIASGVGISPSLLMYGPPGVGKTQLARFIASELGYPLITARSDALISSYLGSTAKNIRALFEHAAARPCVLFLDEFDSLAKMRDDDRELGELKRVVISLMQNIDSMGRDHVLLAATNHDHLLDRAIWRRFAFKLQLSEPAGDVRQEMLAAFFRGFADSQAIEVAALLTEGMSGAQLRDMSENLIRSAVLGKRDAISAKDVVDRIVGKSSNADAVSAIHSANPSLPGKRIAEILEISPAYVSKILKEARNGDQQSSTAEGGVAARTR